MTYILWQVFEAHKTRFYIINRSTKQIQSTWSNYLESKSVLDRLNRQADKEAV